MPEELDEGTEGKEGEGSKTTEGDGGSGGSGKEGEGGTKETDPDAGKAAPVDYKLALPKDSLLEPSVIDEIVSYAKEQGLSNEAAQTLVEREHKAVARHEEAKDKEVEEIRKGWKEDTKADKELGGDNLNKSSETALRVIDRFATKGFKTMLSDTGFGDHPEVVRIFKRIGDTMTDDQFVMAKAQTGNQEKSDADVLYGEAPAT